MPAAPININFSQGIDQKSDPKQIPIGKFKYLVNRVFNKTGLLEKRNGYGLITSLTGATTLTTLNDGLVTIGAQELQAYSADANLAVNTGFIHPLSLSVLPLVRSATSQTTVDLAIASNGLACSTWLDSNGTSYYQISDTSTGQIVVPAVSLPSTATCSRVFCLGQYFIVTFLATVSAASHLQFVGIPITNTSAPTAATDIATTASSLSAAYDGAVSSGLLYIAWNKSSTIGVASVNTSLVVSSALSIASNTAQLMSATIDTSGVSPVVWFTWWNESGSVIKTTAYNQALGSTPILAPTSVVTSITCNEITSVATAGVMTVFYEVANTYAFNPNAKTDYLAKNTCTIGGTAGSAATILRNVGLGSKAVYSSSNSTTYMLAAYGQTYQPSYYLINSSGHVLSRFAYSNGGGYAINQVLPQMMVSGSVIKVGYLYKDFLQSIANPVGLDYGTNKVQGASTSVGIYSQTGINLISFTLGGTSYNSEIAGSLHIGAGFLWQYDGVKPVEHNFFMWPEDIQVIGSNTAGNMTAQEYFFQACYEWTDAQGLVQRSAQSVPISFTIEAAPVSFTGDRTSGSPTLTSISSFTGLQVGQPISGTGIPSGAYILALGSTTLTMSANASSGTSTSTTVTPTTLGSVNVYFPTARQTYKTTNKIRLVIYRWSTAQQEYYQTTSVSSPILNDPTVDYETFNDTNSDAQILGNNLIYITGGVVEDIGAPGSIAQTLFDDRLWLIDAEDQNLLWFSKQVIEGTPVEMSDLLTYYVAPSTGVFGTTGPLSAIFPMDDKLILFTATSMKYINGTGPDNTGSNSQYSQPIFITSTVGCDNPSSIVFTPSGLMFQNKAGQIWLLGRDLSTNYIGKDVQDFNVFNVTSAVAIPGTTRVEFTLSNRMTLMYDYYYEQWGTFSNVNAISSTLYQGLHAYLNPYGQILQETPGKYLDLSTPVLTSFTTGWINVAALQGFQRLNRFYFLGEYLSPHTLQVGIGYDYNPNPSQTVTIRPLNYAGVFGSDPTYGDQIPYGGPAPLEQWVIKQQRQKCQAVQLTVNEIYDPSFGVPAGAGLTLSGINMMINPRRGSRPIPARQSAG